MAFIHIDHKKYMYKQVGKYITELEDSPQKAYLIQHAKWEVDIDDGRERIFAITPIEIDSFSCKCWPIWDLDKLKYSDKKESKIGFKYFRDIHDPNIEDYYDPGSSSKRLREQFPNHKFRAVEGIIEYRGLTL